MSMPGPRLNLKNVTSLIVDRDRYTRGLIAQMLRGFGMEPPMCVDNGEEAKSLLKESQPDIIFVEGDLSDMPSADLLGWIRRQSKSPLRFVPLIVMSGYTQLRMIATARDGGAHIIVRKPVSPQALFERILWVSRHARPFLETDSYIGPDRRFHDTLPPGGLYRRESEAQVALQG
jgi:DNA-binding response OmpR family regulator